MRFEEADTAAMMLQYRVFSGETLKRMLSE